jgi:hypothetical protein
MRAIRSANGKLLKAMEKRCLPKRILNSTRIITVCAMNKSLRKTGVTIRRNCFLLYDQALLLRVKTQDPSAFTQQIAG